MRTIENDIPEVFLELAREALGLGLTEVHLGFMYLDAEFVSPIEWGLWLTKREGGSSSREYLSLTMGRGTGEDEPTAYIPSESSSPFDATYWGPAEVRSWMREPLEAEGEYVPSWEPVSDPEAQEALLAHWPLFELGVRSGWTMEHKIGWMELDALRRIAERTGRELKPENLIPQLTLSWSMTNSFYNTAGHPDHRDTGAQLSVRGWGLISGGEADFREHIRDPETGRPAVRRLSPEDVEQILGTNHPWFVRVAYNDEERQDWLHFPEALKSPKKTLDPAKF